MRFATSYFNPTLYKKNLSRFWPLWVAWLVLWMFLLPLNLLNMWNNYQLDQQEGLYRFLRICLNLNNFQIRFCLDFSNLRCCVCFNNRPFSVCLLFHSLS